MSDNMALETLLASAYGGKSSGGGGGGGGTTNYNALTSKPKINGVTLTGDKSTADLELFDNLTPEQMAQIKGEKGAKGDTGEKGEDGYSPTVTITDIPGGHRVTITDASGDHSFDVMDGESGSGGGDDKVFVAEYGVTTAQELLEYLAATNEPYAPILVKRGGAYYTAVISTPGNDRVNLSTFGTISGEGYLFNYTIANANWSASNIGFQTKLLSGTNIKTVNGESLLGSGNIDIQGAGGNDILLVDVWRPYDEEASAATDYESEIYRAELSVTPAEIIAASRSKKLVLLQDHYDGATPESPSPKYITCLYTLVTAFESWHHNNDKSGNFGYRLIFKEWNNNDYQASIIEANYYDGVTSRELSFVNYGALTINIDTAIAKERESTLRDYFDGAGYVEEGHGKVTFTSPDRREPWETDPTDSTVFQGTDYGVYMHAWEDLEYENTFTHIDAELTSKTYVAEKIAEAMTDVDNEHFHPVTALPDPADEDTTKRPKENHEYILIEYEQDGTTIKSETHYLFYGGAYHQKSTGGISLDGYATEDFVNNKTARMGEFDVATIPQGPTGANEINAVISNKDTENTRLSYVRQSDGTLPSTVNLGVKSGLGEDSFELATAGYVNSKALTPTGWGVARTGVATVTFNNSKWSSSATVDVSELGFSSGADYDVVAQPTTGGTATPWGNAIAFVNANKGASSFSVSSVTMEENLSGTVNVKYTIFAKGYGAVAYTGEIPTGGTTGQILTKRSDADGDYGWQNKLPSYVVDKPEGSTTVSGNVAQVGSFTNTDGAEYGIYEFYYRTSALPAADSTKVYPLTPLMDNYTVLDFVDATGVTSNGHFIGSGRTDGTNRIIVQQFSKNNKTFTMRAYGNYSQETALVKIKFVGTKNT